MDNPFQSTAEFMVIAAGIRNIPEDLMSWRKQKLLPRNSCVGLGISWRLHKSGRKLQHRVYLSSSDLAIQESDAGSCGAHSLNESVLTDSRRVWKNEGYSSLLLECSQDLKTTWQVESDLSTSEL